jgi:hypothetical protein
VAEPNNNCGRRTLTPIIHEEVREERRTGTGEEPGWSYRDLDELTKLTYAISQRGPYLVNAVM